MKVRLGALALAAASAIAAPARADSSCTGTTGSGGRFATCFDLGNRLRLSAGSGGYGGAIQLRHVIRFEDEPDLVWKLEHRFASAEIDWRADHLEGVLYAGRYLRHSRDGHVVLPGTIPRKIFLPFDVGAEVEVGGIHGDPGADSLEIGMVRAAALIDLARSPSFRRRLALGAVARWDVDLDRHPLGLSRHRVTPFSSAVLDAHIESDTGLTAADLAIEGGAAWSSDRGWGPALEARAGVERVLIAVNDRPVSAFFEASYRDLDPGWGDLRAQVGLRFALFQRLDPRVNLRGLKSPD